MPTLDADTIMLATEDVLRRHGLAKATVVDVARELGVSHAAVYRHFPSKAALREAVTRRWLKHHFDELTRPAADSRRPAPERLRAWLLALYRAKRNAATTDPELFAVYSVLVKENSAVAAEHVAALLDQLRAIVVDGLAVGDFTVDDPATTAHALFEATTAFHHPAHLDEWQHPDREQLLAEVCTLLVNGLRATR
ncbi:MULTISPECIES: TetR family transcriptional regulator [Catenuloplanes]|uniref:AcrR family transcriptional regulator n=1 Tax=Catenuloplanes niger TaxID=587534 RepID=A0AAE4CR51_9ACTN|nr:TetR family transcriptional regulator [Catenuloplanes niger]MDR7319813.1 AcrR family transcriptional regulator [Catenuloplanes niger]